MSAHSQIHVSAATTSVRGRFTVHGDAFQLVTDAAAQFGGPGLAATANDLLIASVLTCAINIYRGSSEPELTADRKVLAHGELIRDNEDTGLGRLTLKVLVDVPSQREADRLTEAYKAICRVYRTLVQVVEINIVARPFTEPAA